MCFCLIQFFPRPCILRPCSYLSALAWPHTSWPRGHLRHKCLPDVRRLWPVHVWIWWRRALLRGPGEKETVWRLPEFSNITKFEVQSALRNIVMSKRNLDILIKNSSFTPATSGKCGLSSRHLPRVPGLFFLPRVASLPPPRHSKLLPLSISFPGKYPVLGYRFNLEISLPWVPRTHSLQ